MKTFQHLIDEVQTPGLCHHCGGCVTFCTAVNYGALILNDKGMPSFGEKEKCIECGLCYSICPEIDEMEEETKEVCSWTPPIGRIMETHIARAISDDIHKHATDGGVVTAILLHLLERGHIDGAIVTRQTGPFSREPALASTPDEIINSAGFYFDSSHGINHFSGQYSTFSPSVQEFRPMLQKGLRRIALVGTPCQIKAVRRMETLGIVPSDSIKYCLGLFCSGNFTFGEPEKQQLEALGNFTWDQLLKVNVKDKLLIHLKDGSKKSIDLNKLDFMKRYACHYCVDYSAEYADISFGGIGAEEGWTTVLTRSTLGRAVFADAKDKTIQLLDYASNQNATTNALNIIREASNAKAKKATQKRDALGKE